MSDLSDLKELDKHWDIQKQLTEVGAVCVRPSHDGSHINLYFDSKKVEIPRINAKISDTYQGVVVSA